MNTYWWAGLLVLLLFAGINVGVFFLKDKPKLSYAIAYSIAMYLVVYKVIEYIYWQAIGQHMKFPVEFSALSYFILGITFSCRIKKVDQFGSFVGILAGLMYSVSFWVSPDSFIIDMETPFLFAMALINHHLLYFSGILMLVNTRHYNYKDCWIQVVGVGVMVGYSWLIYSLTNYAELYGKPIIIQICDGSILNWLGAQSVPAWLVVLYIVAATILLLGLIVGFYALNNVLAKKRVKKGLEENYFPEKWIDTYKIK